MTLAAFAAGDAANKPPTFRAGQRNTPKFIAIDRKSYPTRIPTSLTPHAIASAFMIALPMISDGAAIGVDLAEGDGSHSSSLEPEAEAADPTEEVKDIQAVRLLQ